MEPCTDNELHNMDSQSSPSHRIYIECQKREVELVKSLLTEKSRLSSTEKIKKSLKNGD